MTDPEEDDDDDRCDWRKAMDQQEEVYKEFEPEPEKKDDD